MGTYGYAKFSSAFSLKIHCTIPLYSFDECKASEVGLHSEHKCLKHEIKSCMKNVSYARKETTNKKLN
jgi:hypothetical protein